ncbi:prepilin peptidase [Sphingomonas sp. BN140010]|uniref:Prepilin peptidase n=1 Tax=Sphingomonas arvum TaxID=2992113 RepID=A0ABT3JEB2_9SPHN|nr:prepilin peptidase [Sphingomonas sp. BN140010]MCW3797156.1 prepilin peptidase [Sphingomonas sp. BN140010]
MTASFASVASLALTAVLGVLLVLAAVSDFRARIIANRLNLTIAALAPFYWWSVGLPAWPGAAVQLGLALGVFLVFASLFYLGGMGGGDVKLAAALALWFAPPEMLRLVLLMSIIGAPVTLAAWADHRRAAKAGRVEVPYGIAIAIAAAAILAQRYLNQFG